MSSSSKVVPLAYSIKDAVIASTLSRPRIYQLIGEDKLDARKIGRRTIILADSLRHLIETGC